MNSREARISESPESRASNTSREVSIVRDMQSRAARMHFLISLMEPCGTGVFENMA